MNFLPENVLDMEVCGQEPADNVWLRAERIARSTADLEDQQRSGLAVTVCHEQDESRMRGGCVTA